MTWGRGEMKILIVDDDASVLESCRRILESEGADVSLARDVPTARIVLEGQGPFDLILSDIKMPENDGFELLRLVRTAFAGTAVLMMTGYLIPEVMEKGRQKGADGFIAKPFTPEELLKSVQAVLF